MRFRPDWRTLLSAALIVASFPPWGWPCLLWICLIPWLSALERSPGVRASFIQGVWLSFFMNLLGFPWIAYVLHEFGELPWAISILGFLIFGLAAQPQFLGFAPIYRWLQDRDPERHDLGITGLALAGRLALLSLLYSGLDWTLPKLFKDTLGHALYLSPWLRQAADLGGPHLLTFAIFAVNASLWILWRARSAFRKALPPLVFSAALFGFIALYGAWRFRDTAHRIAHPRRTVQAAVIQADIGDFDKVAAEQGLRGAAESVLRTYFSLSDQALALSPRPDFLIWPETAYPSTFHTPYSSDDMDRDQQVESFVRSRNVPLLFGGYDRANGKDFNAFFLLSPTHSASSPEQDLQIYRKNILLLFGEYIPGADKIPLIQRYFPQVGNFGRGVGPEVLEIPMLQDGKAAAPPVRIGPIICYEALFSNYVIGAANKGSDLIMNVTNDSWFGKFGEPELHLALITFRSIETKLPQIRSTNTGISALILPDGEIARRAPSNERQTMNVSIPLIESPPTLMKLWGDWFGEAAIGISLLTLVSMLLLARLRRPVNADASRQLARG